MPNLIYKPRRIRLAYLAMFFISFYIGYSTRWYSEYWPDIAVKYGADFFSGWMAIGFFGFLFPRLSIQQMAMLAITVLYIDEFTQSYHAPWVEDIRDTYWGGIIFGHGFVWTDLVCYFLGVLSGSYLEHLWYSWRIKRAAVRSA